MAMQSPFFGTAAEAVEKARELAAQSGADAFIVTTAYDGSSGVSARATGRAVVWVKEPITGTIARWAENRHLPRINGLRLSAAS